MWICLNLNVRRWRTGSVKPHSLLLDPWCETKMKLPVPTISLNWLSTNLLFLSSSFLLLSGRLLELPSTSSSCRSILHTAKLRSHGYLLFSALLVATPPHSISSVFSPRVRCCWWATEKSLIPNTVWARAHTRGERGWSIHSSTSFWSPSQKKNIPTGHSSRMCVHVCVSECERERQKEHSRGKRESDGWPKSQVLFQS